MGLFDRLAGGRTRAAETHGRLALFALGVASQLTQITEQDIMAKFGRALSESDLRRAFLLFALLNCHLVERMAMRLSVVDQRTFRQQFKEQFLDQYLKYSLLEGSTQADHAAERASIEPLFDPFLDEFSGYEIPSGAAAMMRGSVPYEFGIQFAAVLGLGTDEQAITPGFVGATACLGQASNIQDLLRPLRA